MLKIETLTLVRSSLSLKKPFTTALRSVDAISEIIIVLETNETLVGLGSAPDAFAVTGVGLQQIEHELRQIVEPAFIGHSLDDIETSFALLHSLDLCNTVKACVDMALYDLYAKQKQMPLYRFLEAKPRALKTVFTISVDTPQAMQNQAKEAFLRGFTHLKIKLNHEVDVNIERMFAIATHLPSAQLYVDLNQALTAQETLAFLEEVSALPIVLIEQPVEALDVDGLAFVTQCTQVPVLADEAVFTFADAKNIIDTKGCDYINIKLMKCGGIYEARKIIQYALDHGVQCMIGSMLESGISVTAALHLAYCYDNVIFIDLDGPTLAKQNPYEGGIVYEQENITLSLADDGLGILF